MHQPAVDKATLRALAQPSNLEGWKAVGTTWGLIIGALLVAGLYPSIWTIALALVILGGRQLALAVLMHEAAHRTLFRSHRLNSFVGQWLCAYPVWTDVHRYRKHHIKHHRHTGDPERDPDMALVRPFPIPRASLLRKVLRDLTGVAALRRVVGLLGMDLGILEYNVSGVAQVSEVRPSPLEMLRMGMRNLYGVALTNAVLFAALFAVGRPWLMLLWIGAWGTTYGLFLRIRSIAEHACTSEQDLMRTRTTAAGPLARLTVAPHYVNFHVEHHVMMAVPFFNLPKLHAVMQEAGDLEQARVSSGYLAVLRETTY